MAIAQQIISNIGAGQSACVMAPRMRDAAMPRHYKSGRYHTIRPAPEANYQRSNHASLATSLMMACDGRKRGPRRRFILKCAAIASLHRAAPARCCASVTVGDVTASPTTWLLALMIGNS